LTCPTRGAEFQTNKHLRSADTKREIRLLETITVALTTGRPWDVYASAFDKRSHLVLVLAKNGLVTPDDVVAAETFITLLSTATTAQTLYPFLFGRCKSNIEKRINNVRDTIEAFLASIDDMLAGYQPLSLKEELPSFHALQDALCDTGALPPTAQVIRDLFYTVLEDCKRINISDGKDRVRCTLCGSVYGIELEIPGFDLRRPEQTAHGAETPRRKTQTPSLEYDHGINLLISRWRPLREIEFGVRWVDQTLDIEEPVELVDYVMAIQHNFHRTNRERSRCEKPSS